MTPISRYLLLPFLLLLLSACSGMPKLFWDVEEGTGTGPAYTKSTAIDGAGDKPRVPLDVPPELRDDLELPAGEQTQASPDSAHVPAQYRKAVAGKAVALDARLYDIPPSQLFSVAVDAMTSLNLPVASVDSPSGIVTSDWIKKSAPNYSQGLASLFSNTENVVRYRYIVRVFRVDETRSRLEVRVLNQQYLNRHWVNKPAHSKYIPELFAAVDKQPGLVRSQLPSDETGTPE